MAKVLVTGANGHLGANTLRALLARGYEPVPFVRQGADLRGIEKLGLAYRYGDVMDAASVAAAAAGCEMIVHTAAVYLNWARNPDDIMRPSVVGTRNVFRAAKQTGVQRLVFTSSTNAVGFSARPDDVRTEMDWNDDAQNAYSVAKVRGEREAIRLAEELSIPTLRICPSGIVGMYDYRITPSTALILDMVNGNGFSWRGALNFVDVQTVAAAHAAALETGAPGQRYIVCGDNLDSRQIAQIVERLTGVKSRHLPLGRSAALAVGSLMDVGARLTGRKPTFSRSLAYEVVERYGLYDGSLANRTFGLHPLAAEAAIRNTICWLLYLGKVTTKLPPVVLDRFPPDPAW
jgi:dihydroflavonol-4-reductase